MLLVADKIKKNYSRKGHREDELDAVKETTFEVDEGEFVAIVGRSGGGKSTFLSMLSGLLKPTDGKVFYGGLDIYSLSDDKLSKLRNKDFGVVPQDHLILKNLTVQENILIAKEMYGGKCEEGRIEKLLVDVGLPGYESYRADELSGGELRRLAIARALINEPKILFADEPSGDLDDHTTRKIMELFKDLAAKKTAIIMVTHDRDALEYADKIYRMDYGKLSIQEDLRV